MSQWWRYWRRKGHISKNRVENYYSIDSGELYDNRPFPFEEGEEPFIHGCRIKLFSSYGLFSAPFASEYSYRISVNATACHYGGERHWFLCPLCQKRSKKLYLHSQGIFICRKCLNLAYSSQNRSQLERIISKKWALIHKLGGNSDFITHKPKRMHQKTFDRIQKEIRRLDELADQGIVERFGIPYNVI